MELYKNTVEFEAYGDYALFSDIMTRPGGEKLSYQIPTYEALRGVISSCYWKPSIEWIIDSVRIMNPIKMTRRGERLLKQNYSTDLAYYTYLKDVHYQVRAHFVFNENHPELKEDWDSRKHFGIAKRMIECGGRIPPYFGTADCPCYVEPCRFGEGKGFYDNSGDISYGIMYHGITYADNAILPEDKNLFTVRLWNPVMSDGVIHFAKPEQCTMKRHLHPQEITSFVKDENFSIIDAIEDAIEEVR